MFKKYIYLIVNLLLLIPAIIIVFTYAYKYIDKEAIVLEKKQNALAKMKKTYHIITNLQKIRGLSNIEETNIEIFDNIAIFEAENYKIANELHNPKIIKILNRHPEGTVAYFENYTSDIEDLLLIYKLTAYSAKLTLNSDIEEYLLSKSITTTLPYISEYFARIRGLSSGVEHHQLNKATKLKIKNQLYMIKELIKDTKEMKYFNETEFVNKLVNSQKEEIKYITNEILNKKIITKSGLEIFKTITKNIDYLDTLYYQNMHKLIAFYQKKIEKKNSLKLQIVLICIGSLIIVILINLFYFAKIQRYIQEVEHLNIIDPMTGLYNRRFLQNFIDNFVSKNEPKNESFTILMIDIDFFKKVNDTYGHDIGDKVIVAVANVLQQNIRKSDLAIRYGGEEFMVLLHYANKEAAYKIAQKIKNAFSAIEFETADNQKFSKTLSIGISEFPKDGDTIWKCIKLADTALYTAKTTGRDKVIIYNEEIETNEE
jgi:diguanylate cyclase (GGDEF)-like protein